MSESLLSRSNFVSKLLKSKKFRDGYVYEHIRNGIPFQIRALRKEREWTQADLGEASGKPRPVISRLEDPNYGSPSLKTLHEIASAFQVALLVKFVPISRLLREYEDVSWQALGAQSVTAPEEIVRLQSWASESVASRPVVIAGTGTGKSAIFARLMAERGLETTTVETRPRKRNVLSRLIRRDMSEPTMTMEGKDTKAA